MWGWRKKNVENRGNDRGERASWEQERVGVGEGRLNKRNLIFLILWNWFIKVKYCFNSLSSTCITHISKSLIWMSISSVNGQRGFKYFVLMSLRFWLTKWWVGEFNWQTESSIVIYQVISPFKNKQAFFNIIL